VHSKYTSAPNMKSVAKSSCSKYMIVHPLAITDVNIFVNLSMLHKIYTLPPNIPVRTKPGYTHKNLVCLWNQPCIYTFIIQNRIYVSFQFVCRTNSVHISLSLAQMPDQPQTYTFVSSAEIQNFLSKGHHAKLPFDCGRLHNGDFIKQNQNLVINMNKQNWHS
jgi:hypothetical protein